MSDDIDSIMASARPNVPEPTALAPRSEVPAKSLIRMTDAGLVADDSEGLKTLARMYLASDSVPESLIKGCSPVQALCRVCVVLEEGRRLGVSSRAALRGITIIRGNLTMWGDLPVSLAMKHRDWQGMRHAYSGDLSKGDRAATVTICRRGCPDVTHTFSQADAKRAGLGGNVWSSWTDRMLFTRARSWAIRDQFADALNGLVIGDEYEQVETQSVTMTADDAVQMLRTEARPALD